MDRDQAARRTRAALALGGYRSVEQLAGALEDSGIGLKRLREIYQQRGTEPRRVELREIAEACGLPFEFFEVDFAELPKLVEAARPEETAADGGSVEERIQSLEEDMTAVLANLRRVSLAMPFDAEAPARPAQAPETPARGGAQSRGGPRTPRRSSSRRASGA